MLDIVYFFIILAVLSDLDHLQENNIICIDSLFNLAQDVTHKLLYILL